jgi:hypothetical protein
MRMSHFPSDRRSRDLSLSDRACDSDDTQRQGVAQGMGFCGSKHLDTVLPILTARLESTCAIEM